MIGPNIFPSETQCHTILQWCEGLEPRFPGVFTVAWISLKAFAWPSSI